jgi:hypothetical protein
MAILEKIIGATLLIVLSLPLHSAILKHESSGLKLQEYTYADFCETMKAKNQTLISAVGANEIECFNQKFQIIDFCMQKAPLNKHLARGYANDKDKKVFCEDAQSVMISVSCDERDLHYCLDPKKGCLQLKKIYAYRLEVAHYSMLEKNLNCYFAKALGDSLDDK